MEQKKEDFTRERVAFVKATSSIKFASEPMQIHYVIDKYIAVVYSIYQNKVQQIVFNCGKKPTKTDSNLMQRYLAIDDIEHVHVLFPNEKQNTVQVWRWNDFIQTYFKNKEVLKNENKKDNVQNKPRRNKIVKKCLNCTHFYKDANDFDCCDKDPFCEFEQVIHEPSHVKYCNDCHYFRQSNHICVKKDLQVDSFTNPCKSFVYVRKSYND